MQPLHSGIISIPGSPKTLTWKKPPTLAAQITDKSQKCLQSGPQETPQRHPKIDKNGHLDLQVPVGCPRGPLDHQNGHSGYPKWSLKVTKMTVLGRKSDPFQQSTSHQLPVDRGAGGRGEALRYIYIYIYIYTHT